MLMSPSHGWASSFMRRELGQILSSWWHLQGAKVGILQLGRAAAEQRGQGAVGGWLQLRLVRKCNRGPCSLTIPPLTALGAPARLVPFRAASSLQGCRGRKHACSLRSQPSGFVSSSRAGHSHPQGGASRAQPHLCLNSLSIILLSQRGSRDMAATMGTTYLQGDTHCLAPGQSAWRQAAVEGAATQGERRFPGASLPARQVPCTPLPPGSRVALGSDEEVAAKGLTAGGRASLGRTVAG